MFYHSKFNHEVDTVVWYFKLHGTQHLTRDSEAVFPEYGISVQSTCPVHDCQSMLTIPNDFNLNGTEVWCEVYTEICPEKWTTSNNIVVIGMCIMLFWSDHPFMSGIQYTV